MKVRKMILSIGLISSMLMISGCNKVTNASEQIVPSPSKIIAYNNGTTKALSSSDKEYEKIVKLINARFEKDKLSVVTDGMEINNFVYTEKASATAVEFIYDVEVAIDINNGNGFSAIKFNKLFFKLNEDNDNTNEVFRYGNKDKYIDSSRGPLKKPKELLEVVNTIFK